MNIEKLETLRLRYKRVIGPESGLKLGRWIRYAQLGTVLNSLVIWKSPIVELSQFLVVNMVLFPLFLFGNLRSHGENRKE